VSLTIDLEHVEEFDPELAEAIGGNTRRYILLVSDVVWEMLPEYREREPAAKDALDVYIHHRQMMESRMRGPNEHR
jgi:DNA replication licensing factor MCM7